MAAHPEHLGRESQEYGYNSKELNLSMFRDKFTPEERRILEKYGARIYTLTGRPLSEQKESRRKQGEPSFVVVIKDMNEYTRGKIPSFVYVNEDCLGDLINTPSWRGQVAIFPRPEAFLITTSIGADLSTQRKLLSLDVAYIREIPHLINTTEIIPSVSTVTEIVLQHHEATGKWLLDKKYAPQGYSSVFCRTNNEVNLNLYPASIFVGNAHPDYGVQIYCADKNWEYLNVGVMRLVVPTVSN